MDTQSARRTRIEDDDGSAAIAIDDRLSQLPQPILHSILSLISQRDEIRTSVLSKSWRYLWHGRLSVEFMGFEHRIFRNKEFWSFVDKTLQRYLDQNLSLQKFLVDIFVFKVDVVLLQKWIPVLIMNLGVRSFTLILSWCTKALYSPPLVVFQSESLVELHLENCSLDILKSTNNVMLNNLQTLRLVSVDITDEIFEKIISSCPLIENLYLLECIGLKYTKLHKHLNIKDFDCLVKDDQTIVEFENPHTLESVHIQHSRNWFLRHKNMQFPHLKSLDLFRVQLSVEIFDNFSSFFPCLNELIINYCNGFNEFCLLSSSIKRLTIKMDLINGIKAFIDTPNILYFEYTDDDRGVLGVLPSIKFTTTSNEWESKISLSCYLKRSRKDTTSWLLKLNKLLKALSQSHITLNLFGNVCKKLHTNDSYGGLYKPVVVEHLKLSRCYSSSFDAAILNCFFQICRPRYIHMDLKNDVQAKYNLVEYISKLIPDKIGQDLEEVSIGFLDMKTKEWDFVKEICFPALRFLQQQIRCQLTWKEQ